MIKHKGNTLISIAKWIIPVLVSLAVIYYLNKQNTVTLKNEFRINLGYKNILFLLLAFVLMPLNWGLEAMKWKIILKTKVKLTLPESLKSVLAGVAVSLFTPNRNGEFAGRLLTLWNKKVAVSTLILFSVLCSLSQQVCTLFFGLAGFLLSKKNILEPFNSSLVISGFFLMLGFYLFLLYGFKTVVLRLDRIAHLIFPSLSHMEKPELPVNTLTSLVAFSFLRYIVFTTQYLLIIFALLDEMPLPLSALLIMQIFVIGSYIPSIAILEAGVKTSVAVYVFSFYGFPAIPVGIAAILIWLLNVALPSLAGATLFSIQKDK